MSRCKIEAIVQLRSDTIIYSGHSIPGGEDISLRLDSYGNPYLPGSTLKGLLRESMQDLLVWQRSEDEALLTKLFGEAGRDTDDMRRLEFGMLHLAQIENPTIRRTFTALTEDRTPKEASLRIASCLRRGQSLHGDVYCAEGDAQLVCQALQSIKWIGLHRNRGFGRVAISTKIRSIEALKAIERAACIHYRLRLETPLTVGEQHGSKSPAERKNYMETRKYIPGSTIRGRVLSQLAASDPEWFSAHRQTLLGQKLRFLNALPAVGGQPSLPTPLGFYEDKAQTRFYSVLKEDVVPGDKRAKLGAFCRIDPKEPSRLLHASPRTTGTLRILRTGDKQVFTTRTIAEGTEFDGYILLDDPSLAQKVTETLCGSLTLGANRFAGSGLCRVTVLEAVDAPHWTELRAAPDTTLYLMLLSPTALCKNGELCGMDETLLAEQLGVSSVEILRCATAVTEVQGYNRTLGVYLPTVPMYVAGSVFCLRCSEVPSADALRALERTGLGMRRNEGFGQVLFLKDYDALCKHSKVDPAKAEQQQTAAELRRARAKWLLANANALPDGLSASQIGSIQQLCEQQACTGAALIDEYLAGKAQTPKQREAFEAMQKLLHSVLDTPLEQTLGCPAPNDSPAKRMELLIDLMNLSRKGRENT